MTYDQHALRLQQATEWHQRLGIDRKQQCAPKTDIRPLILVLTTDKRAFQGEPGPLTWEYIGGTGIFEGRGMTSMLIVYAQSVIELMEREDCEPAIVCMSNEGYVRTFPVEEREGSEFDEWRRTHQLGDFEKDYANNPESRVREALMTTIVSFPTADEDDDEPTYSVVTQTFAWTDGGKLELDELPAEYKTGDPIAEHGGNLLMVGHTLTSETADTNQHVAIEMIWNAVKARRIVKEMAQKGPTDE